MLPISSTSLSAFTVFSIVVVLSAVRRSKKVIPFAVAYLVVAVRYIVIDPPFYFETSIIKLKLIK